VQFAQIVTPYCDMEPLWVTQIACRFKAGTETDCNEKETLVNVAEQEKTDVGRKGRKSLLSSRNLPEITSWMQWCD